jgi:hypothetical protein
MSYKSYSEVLKENIALGVRKYLYTKYTSKYGEFNTWSKEIERRYRKEFRELYKDAYRSKLVDDKT